jgi:simple sugar transport system ATP-binding protein
VDASQSSRSRLAEMMVGELRPSITAGGAPRPERGTALLEVVDLWVGSDRGGHAVQGVTFSAHRGEILGIAGVEGSGQVELTEALAGLRVPDRGGILIEGNPVARHNVRAFQRAGVAHVPADRLGTGLVADLSVAESLILPHIADSAYSRFGLLRPREMRARASALIERFDVRTAGIDVRVGSLSGGNQQKVILARELSASPRIVVCCYPTRGLDFAATLGVQDEIVRLRESGAAVLYATVDLDELLAVSDRILVLAHGRIAGELPVGEASAERLGLLMGGAAA